MNELLQSITDAVNASPNGLLYPTLYEQTAPEMRRHLPVALKQLKASNVLHQTVEVVDGKVIHTLFSGAAPVNP